MGAAQPFHLAVLAACALAPVALVASAVALIVHLRRKV